jgi:SAM-dependent methyltransferase
MAYGGGPPVSKGNLSADGYSVGNALRFGWGSLASELPEERVALLDKYVTGPRVLDAGCGGGGYVDYLARKGFEAVGVDSHEMFLEQARSRCLKGSFQQADISQSLPFEDKSFDTAICFDVLEHVNDVATITELARVTRDRIIITVPCEDERTDNYTLTYYPYVDLTHLRYYTLAGVRKLANVVSPKHVEVLPEARVPLEAMLCKEFRLKSRFPIMGRVYQSLFTFLSKRAVASDWFVNWVGVIDLSEKMTTGNQS